MGTSWERLSRHVKSCRRYADGNMFQDGRLTAGGGATEIELAQQLAAWGETHPGLEQYSIGK